MQSALEVGEGEGSPLPSSAREEVDHHIQPLTKKSWVFIWAEHNFVFNLWNYSDLRYKIHGYPNGILL